MLCGCFVSVHVVAGQVEQVIVELEVVDAPHQDVHEKEVCQ